LPKETKTSEYHCAAAQGPTEYIWMGKGREGRRARSSEASFCGGSAGHEVWD